MQVLSIGNSFSQDGTRYVSQIARCAGLNIASYNLPIGGCPLSLHYRNMLSEKSAYSLHFNGIDTGFFVSLKDALLNRDWDVVTIQQVSHLSVRYETYQPYLNELVAYIRKLVPHAKIALQETWAYKPDSDRLTVYMGYKTHEDMYNELHNAYQRAYDDIKADMIIPSGTLFKNMLKEDLPLFYRDEFHASLGLGRYALGLLWTCVLTGKDATVSTFNELDIEAEAKDIETVKKCVKKTLGI